MTIANRDPVTDPSVFLTIEDGQHGEVVLSVSNGTLYYLDVNKIDAPQGAVPNTLGGFWIPVGLHGPSGRAGSPGVPGLLGPIGPRGPVGPSGTHGKGLPGPQGDPGAVGERGAIGIAGRAGIRGPRGALGLHGESITGPPGPTGSPGPRGVGLPGERGPAGPPGQCGDTGPAGPLGGEGLTGLNGLAGVRGLRGPPGAIGPSGEVSLVLEDIPNRVQQVGSAASSFSITDVPISFVTVHTIKLSFSNRGAASRVLIVGDSNYKGSGTVEQRMCIDVGEGFTPFGMSVFNANGLGNLMPFSCSNSFWLVVPPVDAVIEIQSRRVDAQPVKHTQSIISYTDIGEESSN